jgi:hypothetical protein
MKKILLFSLLTISIYTVAQLNNLCNYSDSKISENKLLYDRVPNDTYITGIIKEIENSINISGNFIVFNYPGYNNCAALNYYGSRIIVYDPHFLQNVSNQKKYITTSIIAHEIAHHLLNHTLIKTYDLEIKRKQELEADYLSAVIMKKLGYSLNQSLEGVNKLADLNDDKNYSHPLKEKRNLVITEVFESTDNDPNNYISKVLSFSKQGSLKIINGKNYERAMELIDNKNFKDALIELNKLTKIDEFSYLIGKIRKIEAYREMQNEQKALSVALSLEEDLKDPNFIVNRFENNHKIYFISNFVYFNIAGSYELLNNKLKALSYYEKAYENLPNDKIIKAKLGVVNSELKNYSIASNYLNDKSLEEEFVKIGFSPKLIKKLFDARLVSFENSNFSFKEISDSYNDILTTYDFALTNEDKLYYITKYSIFLINDFEKNKKTTNEIHIYRTFKIFKELEKSHKEKSLFYLNLISNFYKKYSFLFDINSKIFNEINKLK